MVKFAIRISNFNGSRYANKAFKVLIEDDMKGHYNWFSQVTDIIKPGFHYTANATTTTKKQSDYKVEQSSFTLIAFLTRKWSLSWS